MANLPGVGLKKSKTFLSKIASNGNIERDLEKIPSVLNMKKLTVPKEYIKKFVEAENVFNHQLIFCPKDKKLKPFTDYSENQVKEQLTHAGCYFEENLALNLAIGNVCFKTMEIMDDTMLDKVETKYFSSKDSIWFKDYKLEKPHQLKEIVYEQLRPCFDMPEELVASKRKFSDANDSMTKLMSIDKRMKTSASDSPNSMSIDENDVIIDSCKKTNGKTNDDTPIEIDTNDSVKIEVKSRFFAQNEQERSPSEIERIKQKKQEIRDNLKKLYPNTTSQLSEPQSQQSTDSGFCSQTNSQQSSLSQ